MARSSGFGVFIRSAISYLFQIHCISIARLSNDCGLNLELQLFIFQNFRVLFEFGMLLSPNLKFYLSSFSYNFFTYHRQIPLSKFRIKFFSTLIIRQMILRSFLAAMTRKILYTQMILHSPSGSNMRGMSRYFSATSKAVFKFSRGLSLDNLLQSIRSGLCRWMRAQNARPSLKDRWKFCTFTFLYGAVLRWHQRSRPSCNTNNRNVKCNN